MKLIGSCYDPPGITQNLLSGCWSGRVSQVKGSIVREAKRDCWRVAPWTLWSKNQCFRASGSDPFPFRSRITYKQEKSYKTRRLAKKSSTCRPDLDLLSQLAAATLFLAVAEFSCFSALEKLSAFFLHPLPNKNILTWQCGPVPAMPWGE